MDLSKYPQLDYFKVFSHIYKQVCVVFVNIKGVQVEHS